MLLVLDENMRIVLDAIKDFDKGLWSHCLQTAKLAVKVGSDMGLDKNLLFSSGLVHDIGKLFVQPKIIFKNGFLTKEERVEIDKHSVYGYTYLKSLGFDESVCQIVLLHHGYTKEKYGFDYDKDICVYADVLRACDIYDAVTHKRVYHESFTQKEAIDLVGHQKEEIPECVIEALNKNQIVF